MKLLYAAFYEPESISTIFLLANTAAVCIAVVIFGSWPLSLLSTAAYISFVYVITRWFARGREYFPQNSLKGKVIIVTGAATGIGNATALEFAKLGARVVIGVRGQERAEKVAQALINQSNGGTVIGYDLDLSSFASIKEFANKINKVDILVNNAGTLLNSYTVTTDGIETQFGTNYVGPFYLTKLLLPLLAEGRVINVSSFGHYLVPSTGIDYTFSTLKKSYNRFHAYGMSKLAQIWHAQELTRRYGIKAYSLHPGGISDTRIHQRNRLLDRFIFQCCMIISKTVQQGCMTTLFCALSNDARPGYYHSDCCVREPSDLALDRSKAKQCWEETEKLISERIEM